MGVSQGNALSTFSYSPFHPGWISAQIVFISLVVSVMMMVYVNGGQMEKAERLYARTRWLIPLLWVLLMAYVFLKDLYLPYNILGGEIMWPKNLEWLANWLDYARYIPDGYF